MQRIRGMVLPLLAWLAGYMATPPMAWGQRYIMTDLDPFFAADLSDDARTMVGSLGTGPFPQQVLWEDGVTTNIEPDVSAARALNSSMQVTGTYADPFQFHAFRWDAGVLTDLGTFGGPSSAGSDIDDAGRVVGTASGTQNDTGFVFEDGTLKQLVGANNSFSVPVSINEFGQIVGWSDHPVHDRVGLIWTKPAGTWVIAVVVEPLPGGSMTVFGSINDLAQVTGYGVTPSDPQVMVIWLPVPDYGLPAGLSNLGRLPGFTFSVGDDINNAGQIVGGAINFGGAPGRAVLWEENEGLVDLNTLIEEASPWLLTSAYRINENGHILANGRNKLPNGMTGSENHSFLLTPGVPPLGDLDGDGDVDEDDFNIINGAFGLHPGEEGYFDSLDVDGDDEITFIDLVEWLARFDSFQADYRNVAQTSTVSFNPGTGFLISDDMTLAGLDRQLNRYEFVVTGRGGSDFDLNVALFTDCPGNGGTQIAGTFAGFVGIQGDGVVEMRIPIDSVTIPDTVWMVLQFSTDEAAWVVAEEAETGSTNNVFGLDGGCGFSFVGGEPFAGFWANLQTDAAAAGAAVQGSLAAGGLADVAAGEQRGLEEPSWREIQPGSIPEIGLVAPLLAFATGVPSLNRLGLGLLFGAALVVGVRKLRRHAH